MTTAQDFLQLPLDLLADFGSTATYVVPAGVDDDAGIVTEDPSETEDVDVFGPLDEATRDGMQGATAQFVVPASGFAILPQIGHRLVQDGRTWLITAVNRAAVAGLSIAWFLSCSEQEAA